jgi:uncharacterized delta-60 repeat protein
MAGAVRATVAALSAAVLLAAPGAAAGTGTASQPGVAGTGKHHSRHHRKHRRKQPPATPRPAIPTPRAGTPDLAFGNRGASTVAVGSWAAAGGVAAEPDGSLVTGGETEVDGRYELISTRMRADGTMDRTYGSDGVAMPPIPGPSGANAVAIQPDGKILLAGAATAGVIPSFAVVRLLSNGSLDPTFGDGGITRITIGSDADATAIAIQPDGKIVVGGTSLDGQFSFAAARLNPDGTLDRSFGAGGVTVVRQVAVAWGMTLERSGDIVLAGETGGLLGLASSLAVLSPETALRPPAVTTPALALGTQYMAARLLPNGALDPGFGSGGIVNVPIGMSAIAFAVAAQPDGKILLTGNAFTDKVLASTVRLLPSGSLDRTFGSGGIASLVEPNGINAIAVRPRGAIYLAGVGATVIGLQPDGSLDPAFGTGGIATFPVGSSAAANAIALAPHNTLALSGAATVGGRLTIAVLRVHS